MLDIDKIKAENEKRKAIRDKACPGPWRAQENQLHGCSEVWAEDRIDEKDNLILDFTHCEDDTRFVVFARNDNAPDTIDALVAEVERLRALLPVHTKSERPPLTVEEE